MTTDKAPKDITGTGQATQGGINEQEAGQSSLPVQIVGQYVRDISFENPNAPDTLFIRNARPSMDINFALGAQKVPTENGANMFEVNVGITATATVEGKVAYIAEVEYAVLVALNGVPEELQHPTLLIQVPEFAFPYMRQIISNLTQQGGYPPLMLAPVDFRAMYFSRFAQKNAEAPQQQAAG